MDTKGPTGRATADQFAGRLKTLIEANVAGSTQLMSRLGALVRGASDALRAGEGREAEPLLPRFIEFNLASYSVISEQSLALMNGLISAAERMLLAKPVPTVAQAASTPRGGVRLSGSLGDRVTAGFVIENHLSRPLSVRCASSDLVPKEGKSLPASLVSFLPEALVLDARGQGIVQVAVTITTDFKVGRTYAAIVRVVGFESKELELSIDVLAPATRTVASGPSRSQRNTGKKRRPREKR